MSYSVHLFCFMTYHNVTTSLEYVLVGTDFALARPEYEKANIDYLKKLPA